MQTDAERELDKKMRKEIERQWEKNAKLPTEEKYQRMREIYLSYYEDPEQAEKDGSIPLHEYLRISPALFQGQVDEWHYQFGMEKKLIKDFLISLIGGLPTDSEEANKVIRKIPKPDMQDLSPFDKEINAKFEASDFLGKIDMATLHEAVDCERCKFFLETKCKREITHYKSKGMFFKAIGIDRRNGNAHYNHLKEAGLIVEENNNYSHTKGFNIVLTEHIESPTPETRLKIWYDIIHEYYPMVADNMDPDFEYPYTKMYFVDTLKAFENCSFNSIALSSHPKILYTKEYLDSILAHMLGVGIYE